MISFPDARRRRSGDSRPRGPALSCCLFLLVMALTGCSEDGATLLEPVPAPQLSPAGVDAEAARDGAAPVSPRIVGSLIRVPHSWAIVNWSTVRDLDVSFDEDGEPRGSFDLEIEIDFGFGPFLQRTSEEVVCLEIAERADGTTDDIWIGSAARGWVTVPPGATHYAITHIVDAPDGDLHTARSVIPAVDGDPFEFCQTRPDLSASDPTGNGALTLMDAEAGNVVALVR